MGTIELLGGVVAVPALLLTLLLLFAWRYRRAVAASMAAQAGRDPAANGQALPAPVSPATREAVGTLRLRRRDDGTRSIAGAGRAALRYARSQDVKVRLSFVVAGAVYWVPTAAALAWVTRDWGGPVLVMQAWLCAAPALVLVAAFSTRSWRFRAALAVVYLAIGGGLIPVIGGLAPWGRTVAALGLLNVSLPVAGLVLLLVRRLRHLLVALGAVILYVSTGALVASAWLGGRSLTEVSGGLRWSLTPTMAAGVLAHAIGIVLFVWLLRRRWLGRGLAALVVIALMADGLDRLVRPPFPLGPFAVAIPGAVVQLGLVWGVFSLLLWLQDRRVLSAQVLHFHLAVGFLALYDMLVVGGHAQRIGASAAVAWAPLLAWALAAAALDVSLRRIRSARAGQRSPTLLLLRVFGSAGKRERLLDILDDTWRRAGRVNLVGGTDLALRTLGARMLEAFLLRRVEAGFLRTREEVAARLARLDGRVDGDARYPVNEVYCAGDVWPSVVMRLAPASDVVLMDLRGFTAANRGCVFELTQLIWTVPLARVIVLTDERTDERALEQVVISAWATRPECSPNASGGDAELCRVDLRGKSDDGERALVGALFDIAFGGQESPPPAPRHGGGRSACRRARTHGS